MLPCSGRCNLHFWNRDKKVEKKNVRQLIFRNSEWDFGFPQMILYVRSVDNEDCGKPHHELQVQLLFQKEGYGYDWATHH